MNKRYIAPMGVVLAVLAGGAGNHYLQDTKPREDYLPPAMCTKLRAVVKTAPQLYVATNNLAFATAYVNAKKALKHCPK